METPELINPRTLSRFVCPYSQNFINYSLGPSGVVYYGFTYKEGKYKYVPLGLGLRWYRTIDGKFVIFNKGLVVNTIESEGNVCVLPTLKIETSQGAYPDQESACKRKKSSGS